MLMSAVRRCPRALAFLALVACGWPLLTSPSATCDPLAGLGDLGPPDHGIFSPLLKALSEHGGSRWDPELRRRMKPDGRTVRYLTDVYKRPSGLRRRRCNTVRLIKPKEECFAQSHGESFTQDLSYNLDGVRREEDLLKSALLYSFHRAGEAPVDAACSMSIQEQSHRRHPCSVVQHAVNLTGSKDAGSAAGWVEVDVTSSLKPLFKSRGRNAQLVINVTCHGKEKGRKDPLGSPWRSPPLLLYLADASESDQRRSQEKAEALETPAAAGAAFHKHPFVQSEYRLRRKKRWKRDSPKSKRGDKGLDTHLPELLPSSEFPTNDCALYDFRVRFSQLKLDHWIVFPPKYNPRYCRGVCPRTMGFIYGSPVHTMVQNIIYEKLDSSVPRPSCVPSHYSPLSVMIFEEDGSYVYKEFEDMVATRCTCR